MEAIFFHEGERWSGTARAFVAAARGLDARGWRVAMACLADGAVQERAARAGIETIATSTKPSFFGDSERLRKTLNSRAADVVYVHSEHEQLAAATAVWRAKRGVVVRRLCAGEALVAGRTTRAALKLAPTALLVTSADQSTIPSDVGPLPSIVADVGVEIPESVPDTLPDAESWPGERRLVCVAGANRARTALVLRAVAMLAPRHRELRLVLVGPGADDEELRLHAAALGIHRLVRSVRQRDDDTLHRRLAHVGWVTAEGDDGAFGALDFMAAGIPVVAEKGTVAARYVADAITGIHVAPGDVPDTAATIATLLARDADRTAMGNAGRARAARAFSESAMVDGFARAATVSAPRGAVAATRAAPGSA